MNDKLPSECISDFLSFLERACSEYQSAFDAVSKEDRKVQDYIHMIEFAADKAERNRNATALQRSRRYRRAEKDKTILYEEEYLHSNRTYKKRALDN